VYNTALFTIYNKLYKNVESRDFDCHFYGTIEMTEVMPSFVNKINKYLITNIDLVVI